LIKQLTHVLGFTALLGTAYLGYLLTLAPADELLAANLASVGAQLTLPVPSTPISVSAPDGRFEAGAYAVGPDHVRVRVTRGLDPAAGEALARQDRAVIFGLFEDHQAPYPGALSHTLRCPQGLMPRDREPRGEAAFLLSVFANSRYAFGGCADDLLRYEATVGAWYNPSLGTLLRIDYFQPRDPPSPARGPSALGTFRWQAS
jgi:hypothetical protein